MDHRPEVHLSEEHLEYRWVTRQEIKTLPSDDGRYRSPKLLWMEYLMEFYFVRHGRPTTIFLPLG